MATALADAVRELECVRGFIVQGMRCVPLDKRAITPIRGLDDANKKNARLPELSNETHVAAGHPVL
jgi:hypothetical protein